MDWVFGILFMVQFQRICWIDGRNLFCQFKFTRFQCLNINNNIMSIESVNQSNHQCVNPQNGQKMLPQVNYATTKMDAPPDTDQLNLMDTSFQNNLSSQHSSAIWNASIQFLKNSLKIKFDESKGFNDENIMESNMEIKEQLNEKTNILDIIKENAAFIWNHETQNFRAALRRSRHLKELLLNIYYLFPGQVFLEILILLCQAWQKYEIYKQTTLLNEKFAKFLAPSFVNLDINLELKNTKPSKTYIKQKQQEIIDKAHDAAIDIAGNYFINTKISFINLRKIDFSINNSNTVRIEFEKFVKAITKGLFLCAEGCFKNTFEPYQSDSFDEAWFSERSLDSQSQSKNGRKRRNI